ncbi:MAG: HNH endonuclease [Pirellula sp.]|jgi:hypothetical protein
MLFPYVFVPHSMDKMQSFIKFIVLDVWCNAETATPFNLDLFDGNAELRNVMTSLFHDDTKAGDAFYVHVESIYNEFALLQSQQITQFRRWYHANNDIEGACTNDPGVQLVRYSDLKQQHPKLSIMLEAFFKGLYSKDLLKLAALKKYIGNIDDHYEKFRTVNGHNKCPFCGLTDMFGVYHTYREAYDHYLPKSIYPFNSINFRNLAPACHHCNSTYKSTADPAFLPKDKLGVVERRKAFYPYSSDRQPIEIRVELKTSDVKSMTPVDVGLTFGPASLVEEIDNWRDVYGIDERYKAKCFDHDAKDWLEEFRILSRTCKMKPKAYLESIQDRVAIDRYANSNFLKKAIIDGFLRNGALECIAQQHSTDLN